MSSPSIRILEKEIARTEKHVAKMKDVLAEMKLAHEAARAARASAKRPPRGKQVVPSIKEAEWLRGLGRRPKSVNQLVDVIMSKQGIQDDHRGVIYSRASVWLVRAVKLGSVELAGRNGRANLYRLPT